jgi:hypothetical protein
MNLRSIAKSYALKCVERKASPRSVIVWALFGFANLALYFPKSEERFLWCGLGGLMVAILQFEHLGYWELFQEYRKDETKDASTISKDQTV